MKREGVRPVGAGWLAGPAVGLLLGLVLLPASGGILAAADTDQRSQLSPKGSKLGSGSQLKPGPSLTPARQAPGTQLDPKGSPLLSPKAQVAQPVSGTKFLREQPLADFLNAVGNGVRVKPQDVLNVIKFAVQIDRIDGLLEQIPDLNLRQEVEGWLKGKASLKMGAGMAIGLAKRIIIADMESHGYFEGNGQLGQYNITKGVFEEILSTAEALVRAGYGDPTALPNKLIDTAFIQAREWRETSAVLSDLPPWDSLTSEQQSYYKDLYRAKAVLDQVKSAARSVLNVVTAPWSGTPSDSQKLVDVAESVRTSLNVSLPPTTTVTRDTHALLHLMGDGLSLGSSQTPTQLMGFHAATGDHQSQHDTGSFTTIINREVTDSGGTADSLVARDAMQAMVADPTVHNWVHAQEAHAKAFGVLQARIDQHHDFHHTFTDPHAYIHAVMDQSHNEWHADNPAIPEPQHTDFHSKLDSFHYNAHKAFGLPQ